MSIHTLVPDIRYRIKVYSNIRNNVGLRARRSDIRLSPITLITDIGLSATYALIRNPYIPINYVFPQYQYLLILEHLFIFALFSITLLSFPSCFSSPPRPQSSIS
jgi:hypothetical protein